MGGAGADGDWRKWSQLTYSERNAATELGFTAPTWDMKSMADVHAYVRDFCGGGFEGCLTQGCDGDSLDDAKELALTHPRVFASFGCHPKNAWQYDDALEARVISAFEACGEKAVAWGEFGLDYSNENWDGADYRKNQREVFARQLRLAVD